MGHPQLPKHSRKMEKKYFARNIKKFVGQISLSLLQTQPGIEGARPWLVIASTRRWQFSETFSPFMIEIILVDMNSKEKWQNNGYILQHPWPPWRDQPSPVGSSAIVACNRIADIQVCFADQLSDGLAGSKCWRNKNATTQASGGIIGAIISNAIIKPTLCSYVGKGRHNLQEVWT